MANVSPDYGLSRETRAYAIWLGVRLGKHVAESDKTAEMDKWKGWCFEAFRLNGLNWTPAGSDFESQVRFMVDTINDVLLAGSTMEVRLASKSPQWVANPEAG